MKHQHLSHIKKAIAPHQPENAIARYSTHPIEELQGAIGNQAVNKLLAKQPTLQAKPMFGGLSHELVIQPKLTIGEVGDKYEQEADRISEQVVDRIQTPQSQSVQRQETSEPEDKLMMKSIVQCQSSEVGGKIAPELETSIQQEKGSGQPLAENIRKPMERAFGSDFSSVKIHSDTQSDRLNQSIQAKAFTTGQDIFFRHGTYNPGSRQGQELIAHELTHVVQQGGKQIAGAATGIQHSADLASGEVIQCVKWDLPFKDFRYKLGWRTGIAIGESGQRGAEERRAEERRAAQNVQIPPTNANNNESNGYSFVELWNMNEGVTVCKKLDHSQYAEFNKSQSIKATQTDKWETNDLPYAMQLSPLVNCALVIFIYGSLEQPKKIVVYHAQSSNINESQIEKDADYIIMISGALENSKAKNDETDLRKPFQKLGIDNKLRVLAGATFYAVTSDGRVGICSLS
jgi:Domain of unknown function (DUF4157)